MSSSVEAASAPTGSAKVEENPSSQSAAASPNINVNDISDPRIAWLKKRLISSLLFSKEHKDTGLPIFSTAAEKTAAFNEALIRNSGELHIQLLKFLDGTDSATSVIFHLESKRQGPVKVQQQSTESGSVTDGALSENGEPVEKASLSNLIINHNPSPRV
jgi:hypothetical protein